MVQGQSSPVGQDQPLLVAIIVMGLKMVMMVVELVGLNSIHVSIIVNLVIIQFIA